MIEGAKGSGSVIGGNVNGAGIRLFGRVVRVVEEDETPTQRAFAELSEGSQRTLLERVGEVVCGGDAVNVKPVSKAFAEGVRRNKNRVVVVDLGIVEGDGKYRERLEFAYAQGLDVKFKVNDEEELELLPTLIQEVERRRRGEESSEGAGASAAAAAAAAGVEGVQYQGKVAKLDLSAVRITGDNVAQIQEIIAGVGGELRELKLGNVESDLTLVGMPELRELKVGNVWKKLTLPAMLELRELTVRDVRFGATLTLGAMPKVQRLVYKIKDGVSDEVKASFLRYVLLAWRNRLTLRSIEG